MIPLWNASNYQDTEHPSTPELSFLPLLNQFLHPSTPQRQPLSWFLSLETSFDCSKTLYPESDSRYSLRQASFTHNMFSSYRCVIICLSGPFLLSLESSSVTQIDHSLFSYPPTNGHLSCFLCFGCSKKQCYGYYYMSLCIRCAFIFLGNLTVGQRVGICLILLKKKKTSRMFYNVAKSCYAPKTFLRFWKRKITQVASQEGELEEGGPRPGRWWTERPLQPSGAGDRSCVRASRVPKTSLFCLKGS